MKRRTFLGTLLAAPLTFLGFSKKEIHWDVVENGKSIPLDKDKYIHYLKYEYELFCNNPAQVGMITNIEVPKGY